MRRDFTMTEDYPVIPKVLIAILTTHERVGWPTKQLADWLGNLRCNPSYAWQHTFAHNFIPAAGARNTIAKNFKDCGADWILMLDNDMVPPDNLLDAIKEAPSDAGVVVPKFYLWDETQRKVTLCWGIENPALTPSGHVAIDSDKYYLLNKCGTGAIFVRPEVFQKVPPPWFFYTYDDDANMTATEDINFALKIREHGIKIYGFGGVTVGHYHNVNLAILAQVLFDKKSSEVAERPSPASVDDRVSLSLSHPNHGETACPADESSPTSVSKSC